MKLPTTNIMLIIFLVTVLIVGYGSGCLAGNLGHWSGELNTSNQYDDYDISIYQDGTATFDITLADTLNSQFTSFRLADFLDQSLGNTPLMATSNTIHYQLALEGFTIQISKGRNDIYGAYSIDGSFTPANQNPTETENNDTYDNANPITGNAFSGSLGYQRSASEFDNSDYFVYYEISADGELSLDVTIDDTLASQYTILTIYNSANESITYFYLMSTTTTNYTSLAPGTYFIRLSLGLNNLYGAYSIDVSFTPSNTTTVPDTTTTTTASSTTTTAETYIISGEVLESGRSFDYTVMLSLQGYLQSNAWTLPGGYYQFDDVPSGDYTLYCNPPTGYLCVPPTYKFNLTSNLTGLDFKLVKECPIEKFYGEHSKEAELLRAFRDNVLSKSPVGQEIIELYYQWSPVMLKAMENNEEFKDEVKETIDGVLELIGGSGE